MWSEGHSEALKSVFETLNTHSIRWMVLRNYEGLPESNRSKDIDLLLEKKDFFKAQKIISKALIMQGFDYMLKETYQYVWCLVFFKTSEGEAISIKLDLLDGFVWRGAQLMNFTNLYEKKEKYNNFYIPDKASDGFMLWMKPLLTGGFVKDKYRKDILNTVQIHPKEFKKLLVSIFGNIQANKVWFHLERHELDRTIPFQNKLCRSAWLLEFNKHRRSTILSTIDHFYQEIKRRLKRPEASIIAVIENNNLKKDNFNIRFVQKIATIMIKDDSNIIILDPHSEESPDSKRLFDKRIIGSVGENLITLYFFKSLKFIGSLFTLSYYWIAFIASYWLDMRKKCNAGKVFILRNSFYNYIFDDSVKTSSLPWWIRKLYLRMTPKSILIFSLNSNHNQKHSQLITLDSSRSIDMACDEAIKTLIKRSFKNI